MDSTNGKFLLEPTENFVELYNQLRISEEKVDDIREEFFWKHVLKIPLNNSSLLDVGCGTGHDISRILEIDKTVKVFGFDISAEMINIAKAKVPNGNFLVANIDEKFPIDSSSIDIIVSAYALQYSKNIDKVYQEFARVLKPGGKCMYAVEHPLRAFMDKKRGLPDPQDYFKMEDHISSFDH